MKDAALLMVILMAFPIGALTLSSAAYLQFEEDFSPWVDSEGNIGLPPDFRSRFEHLGSWFVEGANGDSSFHDVYTEPESASYFREHQKFPDGATLVKEVRSRRAGTMTTGRANWAATPDIWFVMIKDIKGRFEANPLWGDGWGWALFDSKDPSTTVTEDYSRECRSCHVPAQNTDWVYVQGYPTLGAASLTEVESTIDFAMASDTEVPAEGLIVIVQNLSFTPNVIRVKPGQTITWVNRDDFVHTVTANDTSFDTGIMEPGESAQITFEETGTFPYHCTPHPFMKGSVIVEE
ncbi:MAG TPA: cytochrome P460 family protein [Vicinamibacteria bacterium]|nr:cytochrome P460 family protein [Vicinamibacteria bacterium]